MKLLGAYILFVCFAINAVADVKPRPIRDGKQGRAAEEVKDGYVTDSSSYMYLKTENIIDSSLYTLPLSNLRKKVGSQSLAPLKASGCPKIPLVLVQFSDLQFSVAQTDNAVNEFYDRFCNGNRDGTLYKDAFSYGAVRDYFVQQSDSLFQPEFVVIGPVTLDNPYAYYGANQGNLRDVNISKFYTQSVAKAQELFDDWNQFDNNHDGTIDMLYFIYAGEGENGSHEANSIWPEEVVTTETIGGVSYGSYACCNELYGDSVDGIGVMCHELSHAIGLPDFYDYNYKAYGLDYWDLMDSGCYCKSGYQPCGYSAYEKDFMGWKSLETLEYNKECTLKLTPISKSGIGYKIMNPENSNEYYILENRQNTGWDTYISRGTDKDKRHGMLVSHIDYIPTKWIANKVNLNSTHQYYTIIPADGTLDSYIYVMGQDDYNVWQESADGDLYPGLHKVTTLFSNKQPVYTDSGSLQQPITNIVEHEDGTITLNICKFADINGDGNIDTQDVLNIYNYMQTVVEREKYVSVDMNGDSNVDTQDVLGVYDYIQGR